MTITRREFIKQAVVTALATLTGLAIGAFRAEQPAPVEDIQAVPLGEQSFTGSLSEAFAGQSGTMMAWVPGDDKPCGCPLCATYEHLVRPERLIARTELYGRPSVGSWPRYHPLPGRWAHLEDLQVVVPGDRVAREE